MNPLLRSISLVLALCAGTSGLAQPAPRPEQAELEHYTLTLDAVTRLLQTGTTLAQLARSDPKVAAAIANILDSNKDSDMAATERRIAEQPVLLSTLATHGFTPHQFLLTEVTVIAAGLAASLLPPGSDPSKFAADAHINPANITFMIDHRSELDALRKQYPLEQP